MHRNIFAFFAGIALLITLSACGSDNGSTINSAAVAATPTFRVVPDNKEPETEAAARSAAQLDWTAYGAGDYAGVWDAFTAVDKKRISREDYVRILTACFGSGGAPLLNAHVTTSRPEGKDYVITIDAGIGQAVRTYTYENGAWKERMTSDLAKDLDTYGPDVWLQKLRTNSACTQ